ncbi:hypothetical protein [Corynebacterium mycetoides]|uniref:hypothetical protein n=1 Tax=Corynebacterium mycetoides TaxID=38302 RepID=UPI000B2705A5|nr:hypothetical protein [Corynebacterium mycetoides]
MINHEVRTHRSAEEFPIEEHLAYKVAKVAADPVEVPEDTKDMIINRIIDTRRGSHPRRCADTADQAAHHRGPRHPPPQGRGIHRA